LFVRFCEKGISEDLIIQIQDCETHVIKPSVIVWQYFYV